MKHLRLPLAALFLAVLSVMIWQHRFEMVEGAAPETALSDPLTGWSSPDRGRYQLIEEDGATIVRLERGQLEDPSPGIGIWLKDLQACDLFHFRFEARWRDVVPGPRRYQVARATITELDHNGDPHYPPEGRLLSDTGNSGWQRREVVFRTAEDVSELGFRFGMTGVSGQLDLRHASVVGVRQRTWAGPAIALVLCGWTALVARILIRWCPALAPWRLLLAAALVVAFSWFFVFPQARDHFRPLVGQFSITGVPVLEALPDSDAVPHPPVARIPSTKTKAAAEAEANRKMTTLHQLLRKLDRQFGGLHFLLFASFSLALFLAAGGTSAWRLAVTLAVLAELIPELTDHLGGWDDWGDLLENLAGVGAAVLITRRLPLSSPPRSADERCR